ncbi:phytoene/squalene synthase family protein [Convivina praedatoris]|uniref:15-cis-phytoene synthase n=1 Tax=Convivina praedatoris TaxID=2880963 RepID=A0ABN8HCB6_9LACO|nr:phytoene/squalene synthase family protein [Convivina sp. LMG 32447]CAH1851522.1 15-cis-phytoene synthase [Convivina sp. LMG 32447]CAH1853567.1 15-cis-phytoene synthase [Convivina sp. LMG 32447]CAH1854477.1 15-cis-phytoene synthase [Convivina sp. LMG 32447]
MNSTDRAQVILENANLFEPSRTSIQKNSSSFYFTFSRLPKHQALSVYVLYHFLRELDDAVDAHDEQAYQILTQEWTTFKKGDTSKKPLWQALRLIFDLYEIKFTWLDDMWAGQQHDWASLPINTQADLDQYCYQVAGTVGLMLMPILTENQLTYDSELVIKIGQAMQLTNILRDVKEDAQAGRVYLPKDLLAQYRIEPKDLLARGVTSNLRQLLVDEARQAQSYYNQLPILIEQLNEAQTGKVLALASNIYRGILDKIIANNYQVLKKRTYLNQWEKLQILKQTQNAFD